MSIFEKVGNWQTKTSRKECENMRITEQVGNLLFKDHDNMRISKKIGKWQWSFYLLTFDINLRLCYAPGWIGTMAVLTLAIILVLNK